jgi:hypothetical protein
MIQTYGSHAAKPLTRTESDPYLKVNDNEER